MIRPRPATITFLTLALIALGLPNPAQAAQSKLASRINACLANKALRGASYGVHVVRLDSGAAVYSRHHTTPLILASNTKIFTGAAAISLLGADFRFCTTVSRNGPLDAQGVVHGDLVVKGDGDPNVSGRFYNEHSTAVFEQWAKILKAAGVRKVAGDIIGDDRIFDRDFLAQQTSRYVSPVSGLPFNDNRIHLLVRPGPQPGAPVLISTDPPTAYVTVENHITTHSSRKRDTALFRVFSESNLIRGTGSVYIKAPLRRYRLSVGDPSCYFVTVLAETLRQAGIEIAGKPRLPADGEAFPDAVLLAKVSSGLDITLPVMNKESNNFYAECLFKRIGAKVAGRGTFASGAAALAQFLQSIGAPDPATFVDGSGLSRSNKASTRTITHVLRHVALSPAGALYRNSLAIAGVDGTLKHRLTRARYAGKVQAKTGYIRRVSALSGFAQARSGATYVFSILVNGFRSGNAGVKKVQDAICRAIIDEG